MIAWKQSLSEYEWLIHQVWYLEVPEAEVIDPKPHLIPNPRAHLLFTPPEHGFDDKLYYGITAEQFASLNR